MKCFYAFTFICIFAGCAWADAIALFPSKFTLSGPESRQSLLVEEQRDNLNVAQIINNTESLS